MADFCRDCTRDIFGADHNDFPDEEGFYLCEGCGWSFFDAHGFRQMIPPLAVEFGPRSGVS